MEINSEQALLILLPVWQHVCVYALNMCVKRLCLSLMLTQCEEAAPSGESSPIYLPRWLLLLRPWSMFSFCMEGRKPRESDSFIAVSGQGGWGQGEACTSTNYLCKHSLFKGYGLELEDFFFNPVLFKFELNWIRFFAKNGITGTSCCLWIHSAEKTLHASET